MRLELAYEDDADACAGPADAVLPEADDNAAIARGPLARGSTVDVAGARVTLSRHCPEGFRFATRRTPRGAAFTSWGLPFGDATRDVAAGDVLANAGALAALAGRGLDLPDEPNFRDRLDVVAADAPARVAEMAPLVRDAATFPGYDRGARGVGTRNFVAVIPTTAALGPWGTRAGTQALTIPKVMHLQNVRNQMAAKLKTL